MRGRKRRYRCQRHLQSSVTRQGRTYRRHGQSHACVNERSVGVASHALNAQFYDLSAIIELLLTLQLPHDVQPLLLEAQRHELNERLGQNLTVQRHSFEVRQVDSQQTIDFV